MLVVELACGHCISAAGQVLWREIRAAEVASILIVKTPSPALKGPSATDQVSASWRNISSSPQGTPHRRDCVRYGSCDGRPNRRKWALTCGTLVSAVFILANLAAEGHATNTFPATENVGIGTTSPILPLQVGNVEIGASNFNTGATVPHQLVMGEYTNNPSGLGPQAMINNAEQWAGIGQGATSGNTLRIGVVSGKGGAWGTWGLYPISLAIDGNVGIGAASPGSSLEVKGNVTLTSGSGGFITFADGTKLTTAWTGVVCGGDYAESVNVTGDRKSFSPGDVLVIDPLVASKFLKSADPYSTTLMGIYSTKPGVVGSRQGNPKNTDKVPMAMMGIVPIKASAENGPIRPGDLRVTSSLPGYAMKGTDRSREPE